MKRELYWIVLNECVSTQRCKLNFYGLHAIPDHLVAIRLKTFDDGNPDNTGPILCSNVKMFRRVIHHRNIVTLSCW